MATTNVSCWSTAANCDVSANPIPHHWPTHTIHSSIQQRVWILLPFSMLFTVAVPAVVYVRQAINNVLPHSFYNCKTQARANIVTSSLSSAEGSKPLTRDYHMHTFQTGFSSLELTWHLACPVTAQLSWRRHQTWLPTSLGCEVRLRVPSYCSFFFRDQLSAFPCIRPVLTLP